MYNQLNKSASSLTSLLPFHDAQITAIMVRVPCMHVCVHKPVQDALCQDIHYITLVNLGTFLPETWFYDQY